MIMLHGCGCFVGTALTMNDAEKTFNEEDWADVEKADDVTKARIQVEKAAWEFVKELTGESIFLIGEQFSNSMVS